MLLPDGTPEDELAREVADADLLLMCYARISRRVIAAAPKLKAIVKYGVGIDAIDIDAAREHGIPVVNVPAYAEETVAEGAFALLMALFKRFKPIHQAMQSEGWAWPESRWLASDLAGKTLGLVGLGRIGRSMARMAAAFRMRVLAYDPHLALQTLPRRRAAAATRWTRCCAASDAVSIHCVLNAQTRHLLGARAAGAHEARRLPGERVARRDRRRGGAAAGPDASGASAAPRSTSTARSRCHGRVTSLSALYDMDNVLLWPHLSFYTHEAMQRLEDETLARCFEALRGQPLQRGLARPAAARADPRRALRRRSA